MAPELPDDRRNRETAKVGRKVWVETIHCAHQAKEGDLNQVFERHSTTPETMGQRIRQSPVMVDEDFAQRGVAGTHELQP